MKTFILTKDHLKLAKAMYWEWNDCEFGAPSVDPKRPYGNSDVYYDIAEELGWGTPNEEGDFPVALQKQMDQIHREMGPALTIICQHGHQLGTYTCDEYGKTWRHRL